MSLTNLIETHSRRAASVCVMPCSTSRTARSRNSTGCGLPITDPHICLKSMESKGKHHGNPESDQGRHALAPLQTRRINAEDARGDYRARRGLGPRDWQPVINLHIPTHSFTYSDHIRPRVTRCLEAVDVGYQVKSIRFHQVGFGVHFHLALTSAFASRGAPTESTSTHARFERPCMCGTPRHNYGLRDDVR